MFVILFIFPIKISIKIKNTETVWEFDGNKFELYLRVKLVIFISYDRGRPFATVQ